MTIAEIERDKALALVIRNENEMWRQKAFQYILDLPYGWEGIGEDLRLLIVSNVGFPHHHNVFGALIAQAVRRKMLMPTGYVRHMKTSKSHARMSPVYRRG